MEKEGHQVNSYYDDDEYTDDEEYNDQDYNLELETAPKRLKRHTPEQIQALRAAFQQCDHPDAATRRALGAKIGLEARQVQYWFQNQRSQMQAKALVQNTKVFQRQKAALMAENMSLRQAMQTKSCVACGGAMVPVELAAGENRRLVMENARLRDEIMCITALVNQILHSVPPAEQPPVVVRGRPAVLSDGKGASRADRAVGLRAHAEAAMQQFLLLATKGEPLWLPTPDGQVLNYQAYQSKGLMMYHGFYPEDGFIMDATRATGIVRASAGVSNLVAMLTDAKCWSEMFPGIVASVTATGDPAISSGISGTGSHIQLMKAELLVQSPRLLNRRINFLRYTKPLAEGQWAVMDVSVDGIPGPLGCHITDATIAGNSAAPASNTCCRLLPSGCLIEDMGKGYCKITWVFHAEYDETTVPTMFRPLFCSGKALGAHRWLASLQRHCEYLTVLHSNQIPRGDGTAAISSMGKSGILKLAQRMMVVFYSAVSGPVTQPSSNLQEWLASAGTGTRRTDAAVRMVTWEKAGSVADLVLSASTTVWLPNTPPQLVFQYLCDGQRRGEWDIFANGAAMTELCSVAMGHLHGNPVSILRSNVTDGTESKKVLILQQTCTDASCSMVVYAAIKEDSLRAVMNGGDHASIYLMPSGFVVLPDGHGRARQATSSSSAFVGGDNTPGSLITVAFQALLPSLSSSDNHAVFGAFADVSKLLCRALKNIKAAVKANSVIPA